MKPHDHPTTLVTRRVLPAVLGVNLLLLIFFLTFSYLFMFHSDSAVKNMLAQEIHDTGDYFPRDWNYVNNDLWVFYTHTFIVPLLGWFANGFLLHAFSDLVSAALILWASWTITGMLGQSRTARLVSMILMTCGMSLIFAEHVYGQAAYGSMYYMGCFLVYSYWRLGQTGGRARLGWGAATLTLAVLVFWANPQRAMIYYGAPLAAMALTLYWRDRSDGAAGPARAAGLSLALLALGAAAGSALHWYTMRHVNNSAGLTAIQWLPFDQVLANIKAVVQGLLAMFDGMPRPEVKVVSLWGAYSVLRLLAALAVIVLLPWCAIKSLGGGHRGRLAFAVFALTSLAGNLLLIVLTTLADMGSPEGSGRYLVPSLLYLLLLLPGVLVDRCWPEIGAATRAIGLLTIAVLSTSAPVVYIKSFDTSYRWPLGESWQQNEYLRLGRFLEQNQLRYGYSSFWSAGNTTVLMEQRVKVRHINFSEGLPVPARTLSSNSWYRPDAWRGQTFLMVQDKQFPQLDFDKLFAIMGKPVRTLRFETWYIYVFAGNLAAIPIWDVDASTPRRYPVTAASAHLIGRIDPGAGANAQPALVAGPHEYGPLLFGGRAGVAKGSYVARFDIEARGAPQRFGQVDVTINAGGKTIGQLAVTRPGRQTVALRFHTAKPIDPLELRVIKDPGGELKVFGVELQRDTGALE